jgi:hypothetical protein
MAEKSSFGTRQTGDKNLVWFGEIERKLARLSMPTFSYRSSSYLFYGYRIKGSQADFLFSAIYVTG